MLCGCIIDVMGMFFYVMWMYYLCYGYVLLMLCGCVTDVMGMCY